MAVLRCTLIAVDVAVAVASTGFAMTAWDLVQRADSAEAAIGIPAGEYLAVTIRLPSQIDPVYGPDAAAEHRSRMASIQDELVRRLREESQVRGVAVVDVLPRMDRLTRRSRSTAWKSPTTTKEIVGTVGHLGTRMVSPEDDQGVYTLVAPGGAGDGEVGHSRQGRPSRLRPAPRGAGA